MASDWQDIVRQHAAVVVNAALRVVGQTADAEDVAQEVFVEAFQRWKADANHNWRGLLRRMAVCRALDQLRRRKVTLPLADTASDPSATDPSEEIVAQEFQERLRSMLQCLPRREAEVFCLHYYERLKHEEIAAELGIPRGAVATALCKARSRIAIEFSTLTSEESER